MNNKRGSGRIGKAEKKIALAFFSVVAIYQIFPQFKVQRYKKMKQQKEKE